ncbi:type VI secretion system accessory protein TagJ [Sphingomonas sp. Y38-1Y]|uniref:type VI secretion system accessory protein TagJ n=1 Tax=Sphingomonas sp. Y38-1Y TaxID=3078265 RepID=UPI0028E2E8D3|nr:type VI secretion system accessory protein TagJ [Sphingomonas sp. Y38-1Y]
MSLETADQLVRSGDLDGARAALVEVVRAQPSDQGARMFLFQLLAIAGEWDKARKQLDLLAQLSGEAQMLAVAYNQAIAAEAERAAVFAGTARTRQHVASDWAEGVVEAIERSANGDAEGADAARDAAFDAAPDTPGRLNDARFEWIADADARFGPCFEAIIAGKYGIQPFDQVERIESEGPRDLRDLIWYPVQIAFKNGQSVAAMLPARYPGSEGAGDAALRMARSTEWTVTPGGEAGVGQHLIGLSDGSEHGLLSLRTLVFD